jgi:hypothetical protein
MLTMKGFAEAVFCCLLTMRVVEYYGKVPIQTENCACLHHKWTCGQAEEHLLRYFGPQRAISPVISTMRGTAFLLQSVSF